MSKEHQIDALLGAMDEKTVKLQTAKPAKRQARKTAKRSKTPRTKTTVKKARTAEVAPAEAPLTSKVTMYLSDDARELLAMESARRKIARDKPWSMSTIIEEALTSHLGGKG